MGNDWEWKESQGDVQENVPENRMDEPAENQQMSAETIEPQTEVNESASEPTMGTTYEGTSTESASMKESVVEEMAQAEEMIQPGEPSGNTEASETYHWVNPEYQKRQRGAASVEQNTYETENYREHVGGSAQTNARYGMGGQNTYGQNPYSRNGSQGVGSQNPYQQGMGTQNPGNQNTANRNPGYQGGAYHSNWQNQSQVHSGPETGQRHYGSYPFNAEKPEKERKTKKPREKKPMGTGKKFLAVAGMAVVFGMVAGGVMFGVNTLGNYLTGQNKAPETHIQIPATETPDTRLDNSEAVSGKVSENTSGEFTVAEVASNCMPSVVSITNASVQMVNDFFGGIQERPIESSGSGIIVGQNDTELLIATNNHVVQGAETLTVAFTNDAVCEAQTKGTDANNDLAVIAVKLEDMTDETLNAIKIVSLGNSDSLKIGEQVVAIGNALGYGQSVTSGWVSAVDRKVTDQNGKVSEKLIQTDAAINPGNSGGALLNMKGELIGINVAKALATEVEGMGYAIPVSTAQPILDELMNRRTRYKTNEAKAAYIGVVCLNVESSAVEMYGIPAGAFVDSVEEGGPAEAAGIQKGDVIVKFDGQTVQGSSDLVGKLEYYEAGETVEAVISRAENGEYKEQTVTITLGKRSEMKQTDPQR